MEGFTTPLNTIQDGRIRFSTFDELAQCALHWFLASRTWSRELTHETSPSRLWMPSLKKHLPRYVAPQTLASEAEAVEAHDSLCVAFQMMLGDFHRSKLANQMGWDTWSYWAIRGAQPIELEDWFESLMRTMEDCVETRSE